MDSQSSAVKGRPPRGRTVRSTRLSEWTNVNVARDFAEAVINANEILGLEARPANPPPT
jgi:hypothetical protein